MKLSFEGLTDNDIDKLVDDYHKEISECYSHIRQCDAELMRRLLKHNPDVQALWKLYAAKYHRNPDKPVVWNADRAWFEADGVLLAHGVDIQAVYRFFESVGIALEKQAE